MNLGRIYPCGNFSASPQTDQPLKQTTFAGRIYGCPLSREGERGKGVRGNWVRSIIVAP